MCVGGQTMPCVDRRRAGKIAALRFSKEEQAEVTTTKLYDELDPKAFYEKLQEVVEARTPEPQESPAE